MLVVKVDLWPGGDPRARQPLALGFIANDATGTPQVGNYDVLLLKQLKRLDEKESKDALSAILERGLAAVPNDLVWKRGRVEGFPRLAMGEFDLIYRALRSAVGGRNR